MTYPKNFKNSSESTNSDSESLQKHGDSLIQQCATSRLFLAIRLGAYAITLFCLLAWLTGCSKRVITEYECPIEPSPLVMIPEPQLQPDGSMRGEDLIASYFYSLEALQMCNANTYATNEKIRTFNND